MHPYPAPRVSIYKGDVVLNNLRLKPDALAALDLPVTVRAGLLGSLTLKVRMGKRGGVAWGRWGGHATAQACRCF